ncbi:amino acid adenylation domain-containing protein [Amycolatopsis halotolerans]|uniref:Amino acid adenylation domain-containing protein n=1 Tax=Amycolatopsis halotolerans TaxID=330083 RepID=A0ABV7Q8Z4_9PSEU
MTSTASQAIDTSLAAARSLPELFRLVAAQCPDRPAVLDHGRELTYRQLGAASDRLARRLRAAGVRRGDRVGLLLERCAELPVGVIGVLKAGAAYVPLDPAYPAERLRYLVADASLATVVGNPEQATGCGLDGVRVVEPDADGDSAGAELTDNPDGTDPAYVIYTSGSTGRPKGCVVGHRQVLALLRAALPLFEVSASDRWALFASFSFDVSVWELWACLATGATAVVVPQQVARNPAELVTELAARRVTVLGQVPSVFRSVALAHAAAERPPLALRYLVFAGESVELDVIAQFLDGWAGAPPRVVNMYGPTETTVYATHKLLTEADLTGPVRSPIGRVLPHLSAVVRDEHGTVPDGRTGELWIAGDGVADGYLDRPELTAERFVHVDGVRYYRTGDLARVLPDGSLEYLGRDDLQVKLRGFRIELGEVEAVLRGHDLVREAAVTVITTPAGAQFLVACVVLAADAPDKPAGTLREYAAGCLPRYMVPDRYQVVDTLPLTGSGKLDRAALTGLAAPRRVSGRTS